MADGRPGYVRLSADGGLTERIERARRALRECRLCPRGCSVDRTSGERGYCRAGPAAKVYSFMSHPGEEPPLSGTRGSGTIFFSHCTMSCVYCQNCAFSQLDAGEEYDPSGLASIMEELASAGCHNLNLVTPTHFTPSILEALGIAAGRGVELPLVWNTSGYESLETLALLDGLVDIYLADIRYADAASASAYSDAEDYVPVSRAALAEMHRQVGVLETEDGLARRGLIVRHLVLPEGRSGAPGVLRFVAERLSPSTHVSLMSQYYPAHRASEHPEIDRRITEEEWREATAALAEAGILNGWVQEPGGGVAPIAGTNLRPREPR